MSNNSNGKGKRHMKNLQRGGKLTENFKKDQYNMVIFDNLKKGWQDTLKASYIGEIDTLRDLENQMKNMPTGTEAFLDAKNKAEQVSAEQATPEPSAPPLHQAYHVSDPPPFALHKGAEHPAQHVENPDTDTEPVIHAELAAKKNNPRNWLKILLYIGLGVCIFALILMIFSIFIVSPEPDKPKKMNDLVLFPGLFDDPITLFERGDSQIQDLNQKIEILEKQIKNFDGKPTDETCNAHNTDISKKPDYKNVKKTLQSCVSDGCSIDKELLKNKQFCMGYNDKDNSDCGLKSNNECENNTMKTATIPICQLTSIPYEDIIQNSNYDNDDASGGVTSNFKDLQSNIEVTPTVSTNEDTVRNMWGDNTRTTSSDTQITTKDIFTKMKNMKDSGVQSLDKIIEGQDNSTTSDSNKICKADGLKDLNDQLQKLKMEKDKSLSYKVLFG
jgi:hypothetical protein